MTVDQACMLFQKKFGWKNGADFEDGHCVCVQCEARRAEAREALNMIRAMEENQWIDREPG
jgi:hypothetical protein